MNPTSIQKDVDSIPGLAQWVKGSSIAVSCSVDCRYGSDPKLLELWCRLADVAPIQSLAWELPYIAGTALKSKKKKKRWIEEWTEGRKDKQKCIIKHKNK